MWLARLKPWSHRTFRPVLAVKLLGIPLRNRCRPTAFCTTTTKDTDVWCQQWSVWSAPQCPEWILDIIGQHPSASKSNQSHVVVIWFFFINLRYITYILSKRSVIILKSRWTSIGCFFNLNWLICNYRLVHCARLLWLPKSILMPYYKNCIYGEDKSWNRYDSNDAVVQYYGIYVCLFICGRRWLNCRRSPTAAVDKLGTPLWSLHTYGTRKESVSLSPYWIQKERKKERGRSIKCMGRFLGIIGQDPIVTELNWLHVVPIFTHLRHLP